MTLKDAIDNLNSSITNTRQATRMVALTWTPPKLPPPPPPHPSSQSISRKANTSRSNLILKQLLDGWRNQGASFLAGLSPRDLVAAISFLGEPAGPNLRVHEEPGLWNALQREASRVAARRRTLTLSEVVLGMWPVPKPLSDVLFAWAAQARRLPDWIDEFQHRGPGYASFLGAEILKRGNTFAALASAGIPTTPILAGDWREAMVTGQQVCSVDQARQLLRLADGLPETAPCPQQASVTAAVQAAARAIVVLGKNNPGMRDQLAALLSARIGNPHDPAQQSRWVGIPDVLRELRGWVAGAFLDIFFAHLIPVSHQHQATLRRKFWGNYGYRVVKMYLFVARGMESAIQQPAIQQQITTLGNIVTVGKLQKHTPDGALLWMIFENDLGQRFTVIEWNAQGAVRWDNRQIMPPLYGNCVQADTARDKFTYASRISHASNNWQPTLSAILTRHGIT